MNAKSFPAEHWLHATTLEEKLLRAMSSVPRVVQQCVESAADEWQVKTSSTLAYALHILCGAMGHRHRLRLGPMGVSCPFNLLACFPTRPDCSAYENLAEPWLSIVRQRIRENQQYGRKFIMDRIEKLREALTHVTPMTDQKDVTELQAEMRQLYFTLLPRQIVHSTSSPEIKSALQHSFDRTVLSLETESDCLNEGQANRSKELATTSQMLWLGWLDRDIPLSKHNRTRGVVHIMWQSTHRAARQTFLGNHSPWKAEPPPVLLMRHCDTPGRALPLSSTAFQSWANFVAAAYVQRLSKPEPVIWSLSEGADDLYRSFARQAGQPSNLIEPLSPNRLRFIPELVLRLAMLLSGMDQMTQDVPSEASEIAVETMQKAIEIGRWLAHEHVECLQWLLAPLPVNITQEQMNLPAIDSHDEERLQLAILEKLAAKGPISRRDLTRSFQKLPADHRNLALNRLILRGLVVENDRGEVTAT